ncbi:MAG: PHP domain-containing protein [Oscillospiraceae bacterium]|nr:PHP domain-containing protein [Oscillospiraceae bacterium]
MREIDLHIHSTASDGTLSPRELVILAKKQGLKAIAITDHDTASAYLEACKAGEEFGVEVIAGIEISTKYSGPIHILGYCIDPQSPELLPVLNWVVEDRDRRNRKMAQLMADDGLPVSYEAMQQRFGNVIGRPHFGQILVELGLAESVNDAFDRFIEKGQKYYMPRSFLSVESSIELICHAGGIAVLAHPFQYKRDDKGLRELIEHCMESGLKGLECRYSGYDEEQVAYLEALADEYGLIKTGGSDFHGSNKPLIRLGSGISGELMVPYSFLQTLKDNR